MLTKSQIDQPSSHVAPSHSKGLPGLVVVALILPSLVGVMIILLVTREGIGLSRDSVAYIGAARNVAAGEGLTVPFGAPSPEPLTLEPPVYPLTLSLGGAFDVDPVTWARWLSALLFGVTIFASGVIVFHWTAGNRWTSMVGALLVLSSAPLLHVYSWAWTETLFLLLELASLSTLALYLASRRTRYLIASALLVGLAIVTRYSGAALLATALLVLLVSRVPSMATRLRSSAAFVFLSVVPAAIWLGRNLAATDSATGRDLAFHPVDAGDMKMAVTAISSWFFPAGSSSGTLLVLVGAGLALLLAATGLSLALGFSRIWGASRTPKLPPVSELARLMALAAVVYAGFLLFSKSFLAAGVSLNTRQLSPAYFALLFVLLLVGDRLVDRRVRSPALLRRAVLTVAVLLVGMSLVRVGSWVISSYDRGQGYASSEWKSGDLLESLRSMEKDRPIFSNEAAGVYISTGQSVLWFPQKFSQSSLKRNALYSTEMTAMKVRLQAEDGLVAYFWRGTSRHFPSMDELTRGLGLVVEESFRDGFLLRAPA